MIPLKTLQDPYSNTLVGKGALLTVTLNCSTLQLFKPFSGKLSLGSSFTADWNKWARKDFRYERVLYAQLLEYASIF